jgi:hypothetical protein
MKCIQLMHLKVNEKLKTSTWTLYVKWIYITEHKVLKFSMKNLDYLNKFCEQVF